MPLATRPLSNGLVVLFDGMDGVGKTTQIERADKALKSLGWPVEVTRILGGTPIGEKLREVILSTYHRPPETDLYISAAIQAAMVEVIDSVRKDGKILLIDRSPLSVIAYQVYGSGVDPNMGWQYVDQAMKALQPDLTILYTGEVKAVLDRIKHGKGRSDYFEDKPLEYFERVAQGYIEAAKRYHLEMIDGMQPEDTVHEATMWLINQVLNPPAA